MKELPILFSAAMVQAILAGQKTMTRRIIDTSKISSGPDAKWGYTAFTPKGKISCRTEVTENLGNGRVRKVIGEFFVKQSWKVGDILWGRETFSTLALERTNVKVVYRADQQDPQSFRGWKPSIFMKKIHARIWLQVTGVRVERLNQITEGDAMKEGVERHDKGWKDYSIIRKGRHKGKKHPFAVVPMKNAICSYMSLWGTINGEDSWNTNPWVWVIGFKVLSMTGRPHFRGVDGPCGSEKSSWPKGSLAEKLLKKRK